MSKFQAKIGLSIVFCVLILSSFMIVENGPLFSIRKSQITQLDSLPKLNLPEGADPNSPDWKGIDLAPKQPIQPLTPEEEAKLFLLPPGYKIQAVLTEPAIQQPAAISFDGNGRMYVLELRTYMLDADSKGELEPTSRISRWEDKNNDGVYETGTTFVDNLIFPRFVLPYGKDAILSMESDADIVYKYSLINMADRAMLSINKLLCIMVWTTGFIAR
jgi:hypothetical protein